MVRFSLRIALVVLSLFAFVACRGDDVDSAASPAATGTAGDADAPRIGVRSSDEAAGVDACSLLDAGEVETFAGEPMAEPHLQRMGPPLYQEVCTYGPKVPGSYSLLQVSVIDESRFDSGFAASGFTARSVWEQTRSIYPNAQVLPGVGDGAFRHGDTRRGRLRTATPSG
ncbi:MAG: hypothetical protein U5Q44_11130 [Dehalococcoidia bacterium]|nr:hypothetical protein [Dehalococcoidia bacterium]